MTQPVTVVYVVEMTEYERGWGSRPDGALAFGSEAEADMYVHNQTKDRTGPAPDYYVAYNKVGYKECSTDFWNKLQANPRGFQYFDRLNELQA